MNTRGIESLESFEIDGSTQWVLLRGDPHARRVLLLVQQGPGLPLIHEARAIEQRLNLESNFVVAYWDQRGTGRSCSADPSTINLARLVTDVRAVVDALCVRLKVDCLDMVGFSLGATLATMAAAQNPAHIGRIVAVGIDVDFAESERYAYAFACDEAARRGNRRAQRQLQAIGAPPHDTSEKFLTRVRWVTEYGGIRRGQGFIGMLWANVWGLLASPHYSTVQAVQALRAIEVTQGRMLADLKHFDLRRLSDRCSRRVLPRSTRLRDAPRSGGELRRCAGRPPWQVARVVRSQRPHAALRRAGPFPRGPSACARRGTRAVPALRQLCDSTVRAPCSSDTTRPRSFSSAPDRLFRFGCSSSRCKFSMSCGRSSYCDRRRFS